MADVPGIAGKRTEKVKRRIDGEPLGTDDQLLLCHDNYRDRP